MSGWVKQVWNIMSLRAGKVYHVYMLGNWQGQAKIKDPRLCVRSRKSLSGLLNRTAICELVMPDILFQLSDMCLLLLKNHVLLLLPQLEDFTFLWQIMDYIDWLEYSTKHVCQPWQPSQFRALRQKCCCRTLCRCCYWSIRKDLQHSQRLATRH